MKGALSIILLSLWMSTTAFAVASQTEEDPMCISQRPKSLCSMPDGSGGYCVPAMCVGDKPCLVCVKAELNSPESKSYTIFIVIGALISLGGLLFVFGLRKHWK